MRETDGTRQARTPAYVGSRGLSGAVAKLRRVIAPDQQSPRVAQRRDDRPFGPFVVYDEGLLIVARE